MNVNAIPVTDEMLEVLQYGCPDSRTVLEVTPPKNGSGMGKSEGFIEALHRVKSESGFFGTKNVSSECSMEIWYEDEEVKFFYTVPSEEEENHYRRMLSGYFHGIGITEKLNPDEKFVGVDEGQYIVGEELSLKKHYFEPLGTPLSGDDQSSDDDPYQSILNEMDTKQRDMKVFFQVIYKPAFDSWTSGFLGGVESYAEKIEEEGESNTRLFGIRSDSIPDSTTQSSTASAVRSNASKPAYHADIRLIVVADDKSDVEEQAESIINLISTAYRASGGQQLVRRKGVDQARIIAEAVRRDSNRLKVPSGFSDSVKYNLRRQTDYMLLTLPELAGIAHLPSSDDVNVDGIQWSDLPVKGTLPPEAEKFRPVTEQEKEEAGPYAGTPRMHKERNEKKRKERENKSGD